MLTLYDYFRSTAAFRVRIALNLKGLDYQAIPIHLINHGGEQFSESYQAINPHSLVPSLQDGNHLLTQSLAIIEYLNDCHPSPALLPESAYDKALVRSFALSIVADIHPLNNLRVQLYLKNAFNISEEQKTAWIQHWIALGLSGLEKQLNAKRMPGNFCFGHEATIADLCLVPQLYNARRFACDLSAYPTLLSIDAHCQSLTAFKAAWPEEAAVT